jgi:hypothetical protein
MQIVGIIDDNNQVQSTICTFKDPIFHERLWKNSKKRWRFNNYCGIEDSILSPVDLTDEDIKNIKIHLLERYKINIQGVKL